jgi:hypothetical protein
MTVINSAVGKVTSINQIAYRKLTNAHSRLTDGKIWNKNLSELSTNHRKKENRGKCLGFFSNISLINSCVEVRS